MLIIGYKAFAYRIVVHNSKKKIDQLRLLTTENTIAENLIFTGLLVRSEKNRLWSESFDTFLT